LSTPPDVNPSIANRPGRIVRRKVQCARDGFAGLVARIGYPRLVGPWVAIVLAGYIGEQVGVPVAWLVGPMIAAVVLSLAGAPPEPSTARLFPVVQAIIGATLSASFTIDSIRPLGEHWLPISIAVVLVLVISIASGVVLTRIASLDVATASLGTVPGGASGMVAMSEELGGDPRLVAFMQYARLVIVIVSIAVLARVIGAEGEPVTQVLAKEGGAPMVARYGLALAVAGIGGWLGVRFNLPAGALVGAMIVGLVPGLIGIGPLAWPPFVLAGAYLLLGSRVGSRFDRGIIGRLWTLLPFALGFIVVLCLICAGIGWGLHEVTNMDMLTALLATSPGGIDAATIAALDTGANVTMVASIQMARLLLMVLVGPFIIRRLVTRHRAVTMVAEFGPDQQERTT
jgi:membrane AbrB-like protein